MRLFVTAVLLAFPSLVIAQTKVGAPPVEKAMLTRGAPIQGRSLGQALPPRTAPGKANSTNLPPSAPVVTLQGVCRERQAKSACKAVITREDLDRYLDAFTPNVSEAARGRVAVQYARTLAFSALAEQQGLDKNPLLIKELDAQLKLVRMRVLANAFLQNTQTHATVIGVAQVRKYYDEHRAQYEQAQVRRLSVPLVVPTETGRPLDRSTAKSEMEELRRRAVAGEDFNQLQLDAYRHLHILATPPPVNALTLRRSNVQGDEAKTFDLAPGEISAVLDLPAAFAIVKLESKEAMPLETVGLEIEAALRRDRMQDQVSELTKKISAQFNLQYFEMPSQPDIFGPMAINPTASLGSIRRRSGIGHKRR